LADRRANQTTAAIASIKRAVSPSDGASGRPDLALRTTTAAPTSPPTSTPVDMEMPGLMPQGSPWLTITRSYFDNDPKPITSLKMSKDVLSKVFTRSMPEEDNAPRPASADVFAGQFPDDPRGPWRPCGKATSKSGIEARSFRDFNDEPERTRRRFAGDLPLTAPRG